MAKREKKNQQSSSIERDRSSVIMHVLTAMPGHKFSFKELAAVSGGADRDGRYATREVLERLIAEGVVEQCTGQKFRLAGGSMPTYEGVADLVSSGAVYVEVEGMEDDVYVHRRNTANALDGDRVRVVVRRKNRAGTPEGEITEIIERNPKGYVGVAQVMEHQIFIKVDSRKVPVDIYVPKRDYPELRDGEKVVVHIVDWPDGSKSPVGRISDVLGMSGDNDTEMHAILAEYDLPYKFDQRVIDAAEEIKGEITAEDYAERRDFRGVTTFTIDPADAKDFDDALSIRQIAEGRWEIGIHIADVTHYVKPNDIVDNEAVDRGTSVYLVDRTVPMLPERLSNELCSLRPHEEKLCFSAVFEMDEDLNLLSEWFGRTVIYSDRRFAYEEAQAIIEGADGDLKEEILTLNRLAQKMRDVRFRAGAIGFSRKEAKFHLDDKGRPTGVYFKEQKEANQLIEEFMLLANRRVAEFIGRQRGRQRTMVYRVHDEPNSDKLIRFQSFILRFGYYFKADKGKAVAKAMNRLMDKIRGKVEENAIATLAVRTMSKAFYTTDNIGHYGLAFSYYTHFTSPIRRYPDMMVHRLLAGYLAGAKSPDKHSMERLCEHSSEREEVAATAERASIKYKMTEFMVDKVGMEFDGHISSLTEWGIYVELDETQVEGMVALKDMTDDVYHFDDALYAVVGKSGRRLTLGDKVHIKVLRADLSKKQIDFELLYAIDLKSGRRTDMGRPKLIALDDRIYRKDPRDEKRGKRGRNGRR